VVELGLVEANSCVTKLWMFALNQAWWARHYEGWQEMFPWARWQWVEQDNTGVCLTGRESYWWVMAGKPRVGFFVTTFTNKDFW